MKVETIPVGMLQTNCYIVYDENTLDGVIVDPGASVDKIMGHIERLGVKIKYVMLTHGHFDHILAAPTIAEKTGAEICIHPEDRILLSPTMIKHYGVMKDDYKEPEHTIDLVDGGEITAGSLTFAVLNTKGHSKGSCVFLCEDCMFSGDTLFCESMGRTDFEGGDEGEMMQSLKRLHDLLGDYKVYPGHEESSTLAHERTANRYMKMAVEQG